MTPPPDCQGGANQVKLAYVYLLRSRKTRQFSLGWTTNPQRRLEEHNGGRTYSTHKGYPWDRLFSEPCADVAAAKQREKALKHRPRQYQQFKKRALNVFRLTTCQGLTQASGEASQVVG
jgi:putative endonuclease